MTSNESVPTGEDQRKTAAAEFFYAGAIIRIKRTILVLGLVCGPLVWFRFGALPAMGFLLGAAISYLNFRWLAQAVNGLSARIVDAQSPEKGGTIVARFLLRYLVIGMVVYVTFISWPAAFRGLLTGLCLPVAGMMGEAGYEGYMALRRGL